MNKLGFKTNVFDVNGVELKVGDEILPVKFRDIPSVVIFSDGEFYRAKKHFDKFYFNPLGTCKVKKVRSLEEHLFNAYIKCIIEWQSLSKE
jgi:hypothetical protein